MAHINSTIPASLDPLQFAYRPNRAIDEAISIALLTALTHLDRRNTYVRMLFIDYSSAFNTIIPSKLVTKVRTLGLNTSLCNCIHIGSGADNQLEVLGVQITRFKMVHTHHSREGATVPIPSQEVEKVWHAVPL
jgi:hypothetical protein